MACLTTELKPDIILLTETWCNSQIYNSLLLLPGYEINNDLRQDREDTQQGVGGGLLVYVKCGFTILSHDKLDINSRFNQYCSFDLIGPSEKCAFYLIYRPPGSTQENNQWLLDLVSSCPENTIMIGDFNFPEINWADETANTGKGRAFLNACSARGLEQHVNFATHVKGNILDLVLTDRIGKVALVAPLGRLGRSDHEILWIETNSNLKPHREKTMVRNWRRADWASMRRRIGGQHWEREMAPLSAEEAWLLLKGELVKAVEELVPLREIRMADRPAWLSVSLLQEIRRKRKLWTTLKRNPTEKNRENYRAAEKKVQKMIKKRQKRRSNKDWQRMAPAAGASIPMYGPKQKQEQRWGH